VDSNLTVTAVTWFLQIFARSEGDVEKNCHIFKQGEISWKIRIFGQIMFVGSFFGCVRLFSWFFLLVKSLLGAKLYVDFSDFSCLFAVFVFLVLTAQKWEIYCFC
jgi:hypothetical protein